MSKPQPDETATELRLESPELVELWYLRRDGVSLMECAKRLNRSFAWCQSRWAKILAETAPAQERDQMRTEEDDRLERLWNVAQKMLDHDDPQIRLRAIREGRQVSRARQDLWGLQAPKTVKVEGLADAPLLQQVAHFKASLEEVDTASDLLKIIDK